MARNQEYLNKLNEIISLIEQDKITGEGGASEKFSIYLDLIKDIGTFNTSDRKMDRRKRVYKLGELFSQKNATEFVKLIDNKGKNEAIDFIFSEIARNWYSSEEYAFNTMTGFIESYPNNPEFHHSLSHWYESQSNYEKSISEARFALKIEPNNNTYLETSFNKEKHWFNILISEGKLVQAGNLLKYMQNSGLYTRDKNWVFNNIIVSLQDRLNDHLIIQKKIDGIDKIIEDKSNKEKIKVIEIISFFTAIISFVIINTNIAIKIADLKISIMYMAIMAGILMLFVLGISLCLVSTKDRFRKDWRMWFILIMSVALVALPYFIDKIFKLLKLT